MTQDYQWSKGMLLLLVILFMSPTSLTRRGDLSNYTLLLPWSDNTWEATRNNDLFWDDLDPEVVNEAIWDKDRYLASFFTHCRNPLEGSQEFEEILNVIEMLESFSNHFISHELMSVLLDRSFYIRYNKTTNETDSVLRQFLGKEHPLKELKKIISFDSTNGTAFVKKYLGYKKMCQSNTSELQDADILLRFIRWICVKIYGTVTAMQTLFSKLGYESERFRVLSEALYEFGIEAVREVPDGILDFLKKNSKSISSVVHARNASGKPKEIAIFKRIFVKNGLDIQDPHNDDPIRDECPTIKEAPHKCESVSSKEVCGVGFTCNITRCHLLHEDISICLDRADGPQKYDYYLRTGQLNPRQCAKFHHLHSKQEVYFDTHLPISCACLCQKENATYYYSTKPTLTNLTNHMVVTGARLELVNNVLVIGIMQSKLRINGTVDPATSVWLFPDIDASDRRNMESISLSEMNAIDLTRVQVPYGQVVVGLSLFRGNGNNNRSDHRIKLRIHSHGYDYEGGKLIGNSEHFDTPAASSGAKLTGFVLFFLKESLVRNKFIRLNVSGGEDGGKRTIPLLDTRKLTPDVPTPLSGAGFYVRKWWFDVTLEIELLTYNWVASNQN